jgi:hypothetical protein
MHTYETKVIARSGNVKMQIVENYLSDFSAIRAAKRICIGGDYIEVWRDDRCIYSERPRPMRLVWPLQGDTAS